ncbi:MAG: SGNH/GDSL hydrolase family protein [Oscillospiraceae bacterium]|nr:SGNH/GDSL hydrolase family protein [Oscillospiraceae bacterium]
MKDRIIALLSAAMLLSISATGCGDVNKSDADAVDPETTDEAGTETGSDEKSSSDDESSEKEDKDNEPDDKKDKESSEPSGKDQSIKKKMKSEEVFDIIYGSWVSDDENDELIFSAGVGDISYKAELKSDSEYAFEQLVSYFDAAQTDDGVKIRFITGKGGLGSSNELILSDDRQSLRFKNKVKNEETGAVETSYITFRRKSELVLPDGDIKWKGRTAAFLGDSITAGMNTSEGKGYWDYLGEILGLKESIAYGVAGSCISATSDMGTGIAPFCERYKDIKRDADLIVIFGGTNDYGYNTPLGDENDKTDVSFYGALYEMLTGLRAEHPKAVIVFMTPLHRVEFGGLSVDKQKNDAGYTLYHYIDAIKKQCENLEIPVIDTNTVYGLNPADKFVKDNYLTDGLHPNEEGHKILAERIASCFEDL